MVYLFIYLFFFLGVLKLYTTDEMTADEHTAYSVLLGYLDGLKKRVRNEEHTSTITNSVQSCRHVQLILGDSACV
jgi:hypothetical protein